MTTGDDSIVRRYADALSRRSNATIILRRLSGAGVSSNPPVLLDPVLNGAVLTGATTLSVRARDASGYLAAGDTISVNGSAAIAITASVTATIPPLDSKQSFTPGFSGIHLASPLLAGAADGVSVTFRWSADKAVPATVSGYAISLRGDTVLSGDLSVVIGAFGQTPPTPTDQILFDGRWRSIVNVDPVYHMGIPAAWRIQAR